MTTATEWKKFRVFISDFRYDEELANQKLQQKVDAWLKQNEDVSEFEVVKIIKKTVLYKIKENEKQERDFIEISIEYRMQSRKAKKIKKHDCRKTKKSAPYCATCGKLIGGF